MRLKDNNYQIFERSCRHTQTVYGNYKLTNNSYIDSCIIHVHTRSLNEFNFKNFTYKLKDKNIKDKSKFINMISSKFLKY